MSEHNKRLVGRTLDEIYAKGNLELANELVHPEFVDHEPAKSQKQASSGQFVSPGPRTPRARSPAR
jgi:hypothetical protein